MPGKAGSGRERGEVVPASGSEEWRGFLAALDVADRLSLIAHGQRRRFPAGAVVFGEGDSSRRVFVMLSGKVKISSYTSNGREAVLAIRSSGDLVGELSAIDGLPHLATVTALEPLDVLVISNDDFRAFLEGTPGVALLLLEIELSKLRDADRKRVEFGAYDSVGRVASRLLELAERFGQPDPSGVRIDLRLSQQDLAGWVGASREAVIKALRLLRDRGSIETHRRVVTIVDLPALRRRAT